jgi:DNA-binding winged helix-turn-helix (wHTH) protein
MVRTKNVAKSSRGTAAGEAVQETYALGPFLVDIRSKLLFRGSEPVRLGRRSIALLLALVERRGAVVSKDALIEAAWPNQAVEEANLTVQIAALRRVLGETPGGDRWIETMPRRGYRFVGPVVADGGDGGDTPPAPDSWARYPEPTQHAYAERPRSSQLDQATTFEHEDCLASESDKLAAAGPPGLSPRPSPQRFLIAASVVAMVGIAVATAWWVWPKETEPPVAVEARKWHLL